MDTPRRWQVASIATAVAGLGLGSLLVGRSPSVEVAPIDLDMAVIAAAAQRPPRDLVLPDPAEIVPPDVREDHLTPASAPTSSSVASADPPPSPSSRTEPPARPAPEPRAPVASPDSTSSPDAPAQADSVDSLDSVSSVSD